MILIHLYQVGHTDRALFRQCSRHTIQRVHPSRPSWHHQQLLRLLLLLLLLWLALLVSALSQAGVPAICDPCNAIYVFFCICSSTAKV
jgi:hypothetical protein